MPLPKSKSVKKIGKFIEAEHPEWPEAQQTAVKLNQARKYGASIPPPPKKSKKKGAK